MVQDDHKNSRVDSDSSSTRSNKLVGVLGVLTALLTLATAALGLYGVRTEQERSDAESRVSALSTQVTDLDAAIAGLESERDSMLAEIAQLEVQRDQLVASLDEATQASDDGLAPAATPIYLTELIPVVDGDFEVDRVELEGQLSLDSSLLRELSMGSGMSPDPVVAEYNLGRRFARLTGLAGHDDRSEWDDGEVLLEILGDDTKLDEATLTVGAPLELDVDVTDVLRLEFRWTPLSTERRRSSVLLALFEPELVPQASLTAED